MTTLPGFDPDDVTDDDVAHSLRHALGVDEASARSLLKASDASVAKVADIIAHWTRGRARGQRWTRKLLRNAIEKADDHCNVGLLFSFDAQASESETKQRAQRRREYRERKQVVSLAEERGTTFRDMLRESIQRQHGQEAMETADAEAAVEDIRRRDEK